MPKTDYNTWVFSSDAYISCTLTNRWCNIKCLKIKVCSLWFSDKFIDSDKFILNGLISSTKKNQNL